VGKILGRREDNTEYSGGNLREREHLENLGITNIIIINILSLVTGLFFLVILLNRQ